MFSFKQSPDIIYGMVLDIRSGSIGASLISSDFSTGELDTIFTTRKKFLVSTGKTDDMTAVKEALLSVVLEVTSTGLNLLRERNAKAKVQKIYITISAPWSYAASRQIQY